MNGICARLSAAALLAGLGCSTGIWGQRGVSNAPALLPLFARGPAPVSQRPDLPPPPPEVLAELRASQMHIVSAANLRAMGRKAEADKAIEMIVASIASRLEQRYPQSNIQPYVERAVDAEAATPRAQALGQLDGRMQPFRAAVAESPELDAALEREPQDLQRAAELTHNPSTRAQGEALARTITQRVHAQLNGSVTETAVRLAVNQQIGKRQRKLVTGSEDPLSMRDLVRGATANSDDATKAVIAAVTKPVDLSDFDQRLRAACAGQPDPALQVAQAMFDSASKFSASPWVRGRPRRGAAPLAQGHLAYVDLALSIAECSPTHERAVRVAYGTLVTFRGRSAELERRLSSALAERGEASVLTRRRRWFELRARIAAIELQREAGTIAAAAAAQDLESLIEEEAALMGELDELAAPYYAKDKPFVAETAIKDLRAHLGGQQALVSLVEFRQYTPGQKDVYHWPRRYAAFVLTAQALAFAPLGAAAEIDAAINAYLRTIGTVDEPLARKQALAGQVHRQIFAPIATLLPGVRAVRIVGDGLLQLVPFDALHDGQAWLAERHDFSYAVSERWLLGEHTPARVVGPPLVLVGGGGNGGRAVPRDRLTPASFPALAGAADEARRVAALFTKTQPTTGASESAVVDQAAAPVVLHIAAHGVYLPLAPAPRANERGLALATAKPAPAAAPGITWSAVDNPVAGMKRSALVLTPGSGSHSDGFLTGYEVAAADLWGTELVVLSACETGRGVPDRARGVQGLRAGFFSAGAASLVTSLWSVDDRVTSELMEAYYRGLIDGRGRLDALKTASAAVRARHPDPFYWAPFIVLGATGPVALTGPTTPRKPGEDDDSRLLRAMLVQRRKHSMTAMGKATWGDGHTRDQALDAYLRRPTSGKPGSLVLTLLGRTSAVTVALKSYPGPGRHALPAGAVGFGRIADPLTADIQMMTPAHMEARGDGTLEISSDDRQNGFVGRLDLRLEDGRPVTGTFQLVWEGVELPLPWQRLLQAQPREEPD